MSFKFFSALLLASSLWACSQNISETPTNTTTAEKDAGVVNLYSSRHYDTDLALYDNFTSQTGIEVNRIEAKADALIERIKSEGEFSPADLLITVDAGVLWRAETAGILQPVSSDILETRVPESFQHPDGLWYGLSKRARVIIYNKDNGKPENLESYKDLANPLHKGKVCMRSSGNIYNISLLASMIANENEEAAQNWAEGVVANFARKPQSNDSGQIEAVASGQCGISIVNTYYLARYARSDEAQKKEIFDSLGIIFPNQDGRGTHVNISGAGVTTHAPNRENAVKFLEYLTSKEAQNYFANGNNEYPVITNANTSSAVETLGTFKEDSLNVSALGKYQADAVKIFDQAGWR
ncbi:Fe(3+) ABC transporter substrate-binding protein [Hellea balneolensis]|uniref:Fe(3+) ABC transporter substrate-binding protein n=1 Tax=Hellea balneolensis TaxID=287478 RepID=UPI00041CAC04|nr:Fe(3+) ABC transporter substrate-binding protein [Hellea balneolensis]